MSVPDPSAVDWVPMWNVAGGASMPAPVVNGQWVKGVGGVPVWSPLSVDLSATPPASPIDGQLWTYAPSASCTWLFRYNAASASAYKWEWIGGGYLIVTFDPAEALGTVWAAGTPSLTVPRAGDYLFGASAMFVMAGSTLIGLGIWTTGVAGPATHATTQGSYWGLEVNERLIAGLAAGAVVSTAYYTANGGQQVQQRRLSCRPVRVA